MCAVDKFIGLFINSTWLIIDIMGFSIRISKETEFK